MKQLSLAVILLCVCSISCKKQDQVGAANAIKTPSNYETNCEEYATIHITDNYYLHNNVWGFYAASYDSAFTQCVFYDTLNPLNFGWEWELEGTSKYPSFPRVGYGWNPWFEEPTASSIPAQVKSLKSVTSAFGKDYSFDGKYNTAFDIWMTSSDIPKEENISAEIMIWLDANTSPNTELMIENVVINNESYSFYKNTEWYPYPILFFVKKDKAWDEQINILSFLNYLVENEHISSEEYLSAIEFGNEIWSGTGIMEIMDYKIEIK